MSLEVTVIFLLFWTSLLTAILGWLIWDYLKFKGSAVLQNIADKLKSDRFVIPNHGVFSLKKKSTPKVRDDAAAWLAEQEQLNRGQ